MVIEVAVTVKVEEGELFKLVFLVSLVTCLSQARQFSFARCSSQEGNLEHETRAGNTYGFVDFFPLLLGQPAERIGVLRGGMGLLRRSRLLVLFGAFGVELRSGGTKTAMPRERGRAEGHGVRVCRAIG